MPPLPNPTAPALHPVAQAWSLGIAARKAGMPRVPMADQALYRLVKDAPIETRMRALQFYLNAWDFMNLDTPPEEPCRHNVMTLHDDPNHPWKCAHCGHIYQ